MYIFLYVFYHWQRVGGCFPTPLWSSTPQESEQLAKERQEVETECEEVPMTKP